MKMRALNKFRLLIIVFTMLAIGGNIYGCLRTKQLRKRAAERRLRLIREENLKGCRKGIDNTAASIEACGKVGLYQEQENSTLHRVIGKGILTLSMVS